MPRWRWRQRLPPLDRSELVKESSSARLILAVDGCEMANFSDIIDDVLSSTAIPNRFQRFLIREDPPSADEQRIEYYAYAYMVGFDRLAVEAIKLFPRSSYLCIPVFYLCRHSVELSMKAAITEVERYATSFPPEGHNLSNLWRRLLEGIRGAGFPTDDDWTRYCGKLINHLHETDPGGENFRYPCNRDGGVFPYTRVELEALVKAHHHLTGYCDAVISMLREGRPY